MADDDVELNPGGGGDIIAADNVSGVKYQRVKMAVGIDGEATDVTHNTPLPIYTSGVFNDILRELKLLNLRFEEAFRTDIGDSNGTD